MIELILGMPGTGKSTYAKQYMYNVRFDLGHNSFKSDAAREKFYEKAQRLTDTLIHCYVKDGWVAWDTYPEYFNLDTIFQNRKNIIVYFAVPSLEELDSIIDRVGARDGYDSEFYHLYKKQGLKWQSDFIKIRNKWKKRLGDRLVEISKYDDINRLTPTDKSKS